MKNEIKTENPKINSKVSNNHVTGLEDSKHITNYPTDSNNVTTGQSRASTDESKVNMHHQMQESVYSVDEFVQSRVLNVSPEVVRVALQEQGKTSATVAEAKAIVASFLNREVK